MTHSTLRHTVAALLLAALAACGSSSPSGDVCPGGESLCDDVCIDTSSDSLNCGDCNAPCAVDAPLCESGSCVAMCSPGLDECGGACVDGASDRLHCGGCGIECGIAETCVDARCVPGECQGELCGGACVDLSSDPLHCGACGEACSVSAPYCTGGACATTCPTGFVDCGDAVCRSLASDAANCGACGSTCNTDSACVSGQCRCTDAGAVNCGGYCAQLATDPFNCGDCGNSCGSGTCTSGACSCGPGLLDCGGGCEDVTSNVDQCGSCMECNNDQYCTDSACQCRPGLVADGGGNCVDPSSDPSACGSGAVVCGGGTPLCQDGTCVAACSGGRSQCGGGCVDTATHPLHCGGCGDNCDREQVCVVGSCEDFVSAPGCSDCACAACPDGEACCGYPGDPDLIICVDVAGCP